MIDLITYQLTRFLQVSNPSPNDFSLPQISAGPSTGQAILNIIFGVVAALAILVIIIAAFNIVTGGGDPEKIARGKKAIIYALIGLAIVITAEAIVLLVVGGLGA